jgi:hypothetical protein
MEAVILLVNMNDTPLEPFGACAECKEGLKIHERQQQCFL